MSGGFDDNIARHVSVAFRHQTALMNRWLEPLGLGAGQYRYLFLLYAADGRRLSELAETMLIDKGAVSRAVAKLETNGYVEKRGEEADGRASRVWLTPKGRRVRPVLRQRVEELIALLTGALTPEEGETLARLMGKVAAAAVAGMEGASRPNG
jgi:DNA-binding MarR family transcriptional regulator